MCTSDAWCRAACHSASLMFSLCRSGCSLQGDTATVLGLVNDFLRAAYSQVKSFPEPSSAALQVHLRTSAASPVEMKPVLSLATVMTAVVLPRHDSAVLAVRTAALTVLLCPP